LDRFVSTFLDPRVAERYVPDILAGVGITVAAGMAIVATGLGAGLALAVIRTGGWRVLNIPILVFVDVVRSLPPLCFS
jgi:polar amino acid transport system permease protein